ncbi:MAG: phenylacetic acid degradation bifunctional protein PaaZ [Bacteroidota bacterium]
MKKIPHYIQGEWKAGKETGYPVHDAVTGEVIANIATEGLDIPAILAYGRSTGGAKLRKMTFQQRGNMLKKLALYLTKRKEVFYELSYRTGATRADSWVDIEGGFGNLFANASLRRNFPNQPYHVEGEPIDLSRGGRFMAHHIMVPKRGVAVHINAFNFPVWGMLEKCAVNWMAGVPAVVLPAPSSSYLAEAVARVIIDSGILPEGALQIINGTIKHILDTVESQDVVTFTGSAATGRILKAHPRLIEKAVPFNMEADSLNAAVLGEDAVPGTAEFDLFIKEVRKEMTVKAGQKCTAIRRIIVPKNLLEEVQIALGKALQKVRIGDPRLKEVRMGALVNKKQVAAVRSAVQEISEEAEIVYGNLEHLEVLGADYQKGAFISPILLRTNQPLQNTAVHEREAFGPVSTIMPYSSLEEAIELAQMGKGSLVSSIATFDDDIAREYVVNTASHHGRILVLNRENAKQSTGHGSPLPYLVHGGPGRAGGGEEMGGMRGIKHYLQRCAIQGTPTTITAVTGIYQAGAKVQESPKHPFRYHFEDIQAGMSILTHKRTITDSDIQNFANLTWDVFYAHTDITSLDGTIFEKRAAHGYFLLAAAAGLFVSPAKGPVGANYGLEECRFLRPIYHNDTIQVRLTCKEKRDRDSKGKEHPSGVVKWYVELFDQEMELVAFATILTLVQKKSPFFEYSIEKVEELLLGLTEKTSPKWGIMTAQHMVEHLEFFNQVALGNIKVERTTPEEKLEKYTESLYNHRKMPKNFQLALLRKGETEDLRFASLEEAKTAFIDSLNTVKEQYKNESNFLAFNPTFGDLSRYEWKLYCQKHFQHHFEQFGLL